MDAAIQQGFVDEQRLGVIGGSYGGFMSSWLVGHTDRFRVAVADRSVINRLSFFGSSDIGWEYTDDELEVPPWDDPERYMRSSPITYVKNIHTPLLIIHSENDLRCGIEQSEQLFASLKYLGREVLFVRFEAQSRRSLTWRPSTLTCRTAETYSKVVCGSLRLNRLVQVATEILEQHHCGVSSRAAGNEPPGCVVAPV